jgi:general secretion pathway protein L
MAAPAIADRLAPALETAGAYWRWWIAELAAMLPASLRRRLSGGPQALIAEPLDGREVQFRFRRLERGRLAPVEAGAAPVGLAVWLMLPEHMALIRRLSWPVMSAGDLDRSLRFDLDRQTPCAAETLWFDFEVVGRDPRRRRLTIDLAVVQANAVQGLRARLEERDGMEPQRVGIATADGALRFDLRPAGAGAAAKPAALMPSTWRGRLLLLCAALGMLNLGIHAHLEQARRDRLDAAVQDARRRVQRVDALRTQIAERRQLRDDLMTRRADIGLLAILDQLTRLLPDHAWLDSVEVRGGSVYVTGYAPVAATLVAQIEASPMFADAQFRSPVTPDRARSRERFDMAIRLRGRS